MGALPGDQRRQLKVLLPRSRTRSRCPAWSASPSASRGTRWTSAVTGGATRSCAPRTRSREPGQGAVDPVHGRCLHAGRVFRAGASYYRFGGDKVPLPFDNNTGSARGLRQRLQEVRRQARHLVAQARRPPAPPLAVRPGLGRAQPWRRGPRRPGYTERGGSGRTAADQDRRPSTPARLAVELPLSGYGPLSEGQSAALATKVIKTVGRNSPRFFVQANGWDETQEWGSPNTTGRGHFDAVWRSR